MQREAKAAVTPVRQRSQFTCMSASMAMCLRALDYDVTEDEVNKVMGARPMKGAAWEQVLATAQHYGCRATLTMPATVEQLKQWTDAGIPIMIAWNPEGRDWSHASVVFDVDDELNVYVADPNIPNPKKTVRVVSEDEFYGKWYEKFPNYLVRRPACAIEREITSEGHQVNILGGEEAQPEALKLLASTRSDQKMARTVKDTDGREWGPKRGLEGPFLSKGRRVLYYDKRENGGTYYDPTTDIYLSNAEASRVVMAGKKRPQTQKTRMKVDKTPSKPRSEHAKAMAEGKSYGGGAAGKHKNKQDFARGHKRQPKHKGRPRQAVENVAERCFQAASGFWTSIGVSGFKHVDDGILAFLTPKTLWGTTKDRNIPDLSDVADPEMLADGIPELMESYNDAEKAHAQWVRQGWWPKPVKTQGWHLMIVNRSRNKGFEATFKASEKNKALANGEMAANVIRDSKRPRWMDPVKVGGYKGNPDGKSIYPVDVDHGEEHTLSGGHDIMKRVQDELRVEQGNKPRENQETRLAAAQPEMQIKGRRVRVNDAFLEQLKKKYEVRRSGNGGWSFIHPEADEPLSVDRDVTDFEFYFFPAGRARPWGDEKGWWDVMYMPGFLILLQKVGDILRAQTTRLARYEVNSPAQAGAVNRLACRFVSAHMEDDQG